MRLSSRAAALALGLAVALLITLVGPLLLFNPWFVGLEQRRADVAPRLGVEQAAVDRVTTEILGDLFAGGDFDVALDGETPLLDAEERSHMRDVSGLVRILLLVTGGAAVVAAVLGARLHREPARLGRVLLCAAAAVGGIAIALAVIFAVAFEPAFLAFHTLFFAEGTYLFPPGSELITLFPQQLWFESTLVAGALIAMDAVLVALLGMRLASRSANAREGR